MVADGVRICTESTRPGVLGDLRVGVDLMAVDQVAASITQFGERYLSRLFSPAELIDCQGSPAVSAASLAARFAAKEAVRKVLRSPEHQPPWPSIEIRRQPTGGAEIHLAGPAEHCARAEGILSWSLSMSHEAGMAVAVVIARGDGVLDRAEAANL